MKKFLSVLIARNKEFTRDRASLAWSLLFPILVIFGFAFAFSESSQNVFKVGVTERRGSSSQSLAPSASQNELGQLKYIEFIQEQDLNILISKLKRHQLDMVILEGESPGPKYWINSTSPKGYLLEKILQGIETAGSHSQSSYQKQTVQGKEIRYVDWLISGLLGMNMMFSALFGVGYTIVRYRKNGVLKRLSATPLSAFEFLLAQIASRLILIVCVSSSIYIGCHWMIHFQMLGSYFNLFLVLCLGAMCMISLSLLIASRIASEELAGGLLNLISWPMMFLSGVWFSLEGAHPWVKNFALAFPLTHIIDASRAIMTEGAGIEIIAPHLIALACMTVLFLGTSSAIFKWK